MKVSTCTLLAFMNIFYILSLSSQSKDIDSLKILLPEQNGNDRILSYFALFKSYKSNTDSSILYLRKGLDLSQELKSKDAIIDGYNLLSEYWLNQGQADSTISAVKHLLKLLPNRASIQRAKAYSYYGEALSKLAQYEKSAQWHLKSLVDSEEINYPIGIATSLNNLGNVYWYLNDLDSALSYYEKALNISKENNEDIITAKVLGNIGLINHTQGKLQNAKIAFEEALEVKRKLNDQLEVAITLQNMGRLFQQLEEYNNARKYYTESISISKKINDHIGVIYTLQNLASLEANTNNHKTALKLLDTVLAISKENNFKEGIKDFYNLNSHVLYEMNKGGVAFENRLQYEAYKDTIANEKYLEKTKELELKYETEKKQNEILQLSEENLKNEATISKKNSWIKTLLFGGFSLAIIAFAGFFVFRQKIYLKQQQKLFTTISQTELKEQERISRDLHDSVGAMLATVTNQLSQVKISDDEQKNHLKKAQQLLTKTADETRRISHNMMPEELTKFGLVNAIESTVQEVITTKKLSIDFLHYGMEERLDTIKELHIYRIVQELFQNIIKHAQATKGSLQFTKHKNEFNIIVEDNGKGFENSSNSGDGLGLQNIQSRVDFLNGSMNVDTKRDKGTTVNISIPLV